MPGEKLGGFAAVGADPDEGRRIAQGFAEKAQRYQAVRQEAEQLRLTAASADGRIRVTVGADGNVTNLEFTDKVRTMAPQELAAQILSTMHRAQSDIAARVGETMAVHLGDEDQDTRAMTLGNLRERFPEPSEEPEPEPASSKWDGPAEDAAPTPPPAPQPPAAPPARPRRRPLDEDDDFGPDFDPLRD